MVARQRRDREIEAIVPFTPYRRIERENNEEAPVNFTLPGFVPLEQDYYAPPRRELPEVEDYVRRPGPPLWEFGVNALPNAGVLETISRLQRANNVLQENNMQLQGERTAFRIGTLGLGRALGEMSEAFRVWKAAMRSIENSAVYLQQITE